MWAPAPSERHIEIFLVVTLMYHHNQWTRDAATARTGIGIPPLLYEFSWEQRRIIIVATRTLLWDAVGRCASYFSIVHVTLRSCLEVVTRIIAGNTAAGWGPCASREKIDIFVVVTPKCIIFSGGMGPQPLVPRSTFHRCSSHSVSSTVKLKSLLSLDHTVVAKNVTLL